MNFVKSIFLTLAVALTSLSAVAQPQLLDPVSWSTSVEKIAEGEYRVDFLQAGKNLAVKLIILINHPGQQDNRHTIIGNYLCDFFHRLYLLKYPRFGSHRHPHGKGGACHCHSPPGKGQG